MKRDRFRSTRALVMNGPGCRILRERSIPAKAPRAELVLRSESRNLRDLMSDRPDRLVCLTGNGRGLALEYASDPVAEDRREVIRQIIARPESHRRAGDFERRAVFAQRDMLGHLSQLMPKSLQEKVISQAPESVLHHPAQELVNVVARELQNGTDLF